MAVDLPQVERICDEIERRYKRPYEGVNKEELIYLQGRLSSDVPALVDELKLANRKLAILRRLFMGKK